jgi:glycosyltransferase involved in cell wall biosynthesis
MSSEIKYSIIIPCYNEGIIVEKVITELTNLLVERYRGSCELIAVDDGSSDDTGRKLDNLQLPNFYKLSNPYNIGYGSALALGAAHSKADYLIFYDGDGQHNPLDLARLIDANKEGKFDMIVGSREGYQGPRWRMPGKRFLTILANYLVNFKIPDINSGLRLVKRDSFNKFKHLYPKGFSLSTTITLAFIKHGFSVLYIPIEINKRVGTSTVKISDGFQTINLIIRMIMLFSPLKIFVPCSFIFFVLTLISLYVDLFIYNFNLSEMTLIFFIASIMLFFIGLLADQLAALRREIKL